MEKTYPKSAFKLLIKLNPFAPVSGLSNDILFTLVAQKTAKLRSVKVGGLKKKTAAQFDLHHPRAAQDRILDFFPYLQL